MATISTTEYLLDQAKRRLTPSINNFPGMAAVEQRLLNTNWKQSTLAEPPAGSGLKPVMGDRGPADPRPHDRDVARRARTTCCSCTKTKGRSYSRDSPALPGVVALGPDAAQAVYLQPQQGLLAAGWEPVIGPFFNRGLMLLDFDEHMFHRRIMQEAFIRSRLVGYVEHIDQVVSQVIANDWVDNDPRFLFYPAMKELTLDIASMVFMGHEPGTDHELVTKVNKAFTITTRAGNAIIRTSVPPFTWWRGLQARELLENYFRGARQGAPRQGGHRPAHCAVPDRGRGRQQLLRRGHRQPHDLPDDGRARHLDVDARRRWPTTWPPTRSGRNAAATSPIGSATVRWTSSHWKSWRRSIW